ncbi:ankyrin [Polychaeton citri CBS 116435]|uniref:Ankyrin n=1 Tax=Polychaeton citri CBS 116435 TaxID=1314669 RepID=A0A9P4UPE9_9PEZI|nr:ankyrin [Polychaeton citri CBS 116435]
MVSLFARGWVVPRQARCSLITIFLRQDKPRFHTQLLNLGPLQYINRQTAVGSDLRTTRSSQHHLQRSATSMAANPADSAEIRLPPIPANHKDFIHHVASAAPGKSMRELLEPYRAYDNEMRKVFAQHPAHPAIKEPSVVPVFTGDESKVRIRARNLKAESTEERDSYIMPLTMEERRPDGSPAIVQSIQEFKTNFSIFSESSLADLDWSNVVVAGSAVVTSMLAVPNEHSGSKKALRTYYHEQLAPASDVDLFIYGLDEEQAKEKIKQIDRAVRDALLVETTTVRTKHAITIASQYPTRHVQIVLRIYKSISEILTGFDVDCSCAAFDGNQVWASPRALVAFMTQTNTVDLTRRSPSYENRLSKYSHRGFEVYWPNLKRSRIDPTIFERSFGRTEGLARLLILEKLPKIEDRERYNDQRRAERGRPGINRTRANRYKIYGNVKNDYEDEVADWVDGDEVSDYHTFTIPYGPKFHAKKIEKLLYTKDLLLNAEWNRPKDREVNLHRHPAFFGTAEIVMHDCCGYCPQPTNEEEEEIAEEEAKVYLSGGLSFIKDDPGRQTIGSFHPLTADDWTEMAYVGNTQMLCQAIVDGDVEYVRNWLAQEGNDPDTRDYTGRAPLHLATAQSTLDVVKALVDGGSRIVARLVDGKTALHLAAMRGEAEMVRVLLQKSEANQAEEDEKLEARRMARRAAKGVGASTTQDTSQIEGANPSEEGSDIDMVDDAASSKVDATTEGSMVNIKSLSMNDKDQAPENQIEDEDDDDPDVYDIDVLAWDVAVSALHLAIVQGHINVVKVLVEDFAADVLLPVKLYNDYDKSARAAILTLVLGMRLPLEQSREMTKALIGLGASSAQADLNQQTAFQQAVATAPDLLDTLFEHDKTGAMRAINNVSLSGYQYRPNTTTALLMAIDAEDEETASRLLDLGAKAIVDSTTFTKAYIGKYDDSYAKDSKTNRKQFDESVEQPVFAAVKKGLPLLAKRLVDAHGVDPNGLSQTGHRVLNNDTQRRYTNGTSLLDEVRDRIKTLRDWAPPESKHEPPEPLKGDKEYLGAYQEGSFAHWSACQQLQHEKESYKQAWENHVAAVKKWDKSQEGVEEKQADKLNQLDQYRQLEASLLKKEAKTFRELHPDIEPAENRTYHYGNNRMDHKQKPFEVNIDFQQASLTDECRERYLGLFEAAWRGDTQGVKQYTLKCWTNAEGEEQPPLEIAVSDSEHRLDCFQIACLHGDFELANVCLEIAHAQYCPPEKRGSNRRYRIDNDEDEDMDDDDADSDEEVRIASDIVDEQFTIDNIGEVSMQVKSGTSPYWILERDSFDVRSLFNDGDGSNKSAGPYIGLSYTGQSDTEVRSPAKRTNTGSIKLPRPFEELSRERRRQLSKPRNLFQLAIWNDDRDLLSFLMSLGRQYMSKPSSDDEDNEAPPLSFYTVAEDDFLYAIELDRPHFVAEFIKSACAGLYLGSLINDMGIQMIEKPKYYQGLSVYGKKRRDWAERGRNVASFGSMSDKSPPLLYAAKYGSLACVEWFLSDAPMRCYQQFAETHREDKYLRKLADAAAQGKISGGFDAIVNKYLSNRIELAPHCCLLEAWHPEKTRVLKYLLRAMPQSVNKKNVDGITPLQIAFWTYNKEAADVLLEAGADTKTRDKDGRNLLHILLRPNSQDGEIERIKKMMAVIDSSLLPDLFTQRCSCHPGSLTPLAYWIESARDGRNAKVKPHEVLRCILEYSKGIELAQINGKGDTPLHICTMNHCPDLARVILEHDANLLFRENAVGRTPYEIEEERQITRKFSAPESRSQNRRDRVHHGGLFGNNNDNSNHTKSDSADRHLSIWEVLCEFKTILDGRGGGKRRLVTLNEANEVAKRLAARQTPSQGYDHDSVNSEKTTEAKWDEVQIWSSWS